MAGESEREAASIEDVRINAVFRMLGEGDGQICPAVAPAGDAVFRPEAFRGRVPDAMIRLLSDMDKKLDAILGYLRRESLEKEFPHRAQVVRLGAEHLTLECREPLAPEDMLELVMLVGDSPLASGILKVDSLRKERIAGGSGAYDAVFATVRADDREAIIQWIFQETRRRIRQRWGESTVPHSY